jgi:thiamine-phosphate pyrophosphorylase
VLTPPVLMMVTDRHRSGARSAGDPSARASWAALPALAATAARAGVDVIQLRERGLEDRSLLALAAAVRLAIAGTRTRLVVNERIDVALAAGADGVHLPGSAVTCARARTILADGFLVGRSVHSAAEAIAAEGSGGCDYLVFGTVFESESKPAGHRAAGLSALADVCAAVRLPVLAIGGITPARVPAVVKAGAAGIAAIGLFAAGGERELRDAVGQIRLAFASH